VAAAEAVPVSVSPPFGVSPKGGRVGYAGGQRRSIARETERRAVMLVIDPVCRTELDDREAVATYPYGGDTFHFCSEECRESFAATPEDYLGELDRWLVEAGEAEAV
jgi:YHS domain-containing protein